MNNDSRRALRFAALAILVSAILALALVVPTRAGSSCADTSGAPMPAFALPGWFGMVVAIEPETGRLVLPDAEAMLALTQQERTGLLWTSVGLTEVRFPDGTVMIDLQGRFMEFAVAQIGPDGHLQFRCLDGSTALPAPPTPLAPAPALEER